MWHGSWHYIVKLTNQFVSARWPTISLPVCQRIIKASPIINCGKLCRKWGCEPRKAQQQQSQTVGATFTTASLCPWSEDNKDNLLDLDAYEEQKAAVHKNNMNCSDIHCVTYTETDLRFVCSLCISLKWNHSVETKHRRWQHWTVYCTFPVIYIEKSNHLGHTFDRWLGCWSIFILVDGWWLFCVMLISPAGWSQTCTLHPDNA